MPAGFFHDLTKPTKMAEFMDTLSLVLAKAESERKIQ